MENGDKEALGASRCRDQRAPTLDFSHHKPTPRVNRVRRVRGRVAAMAALATPRLGWRLHPDAVGRGCRGVPAERAGPGPPARARDSPRRDVSQTGRSAASEPPRPPTPAGPRSAPPLAPAKAGTTIVPAGAGQPSCWGGGWARGGGGPLPLASATVELSVSMV